MIRMIIGGSLKRGPVQTLSEIPPINVTVHVTSGITLYSRPAW